MVRSEFRSEMGWPRRMEGGILIRNIKTVGKTGLEEKWGKQGRGKTVRLWQIFALGQFLGLMVPFIEVKI